MIRGLMTDEEWAIFAPLLTTPCSRGGRPPKNHRDELPDGGARSKTCIVARCHHSLRAAKSCGAPQPDLQFHAHGLDICTAHRTRILRTTVQSDRRNLRGGCRAGLLKAGKSFLQAAGGANIATAAVQCGNQTFRVTVRGVGVRHRDRCSAVISRVQDLVDRGALPVETLCTEDTRTQCWCGPCTPIAPQQATIIRVNCRWCPALETKHHPTPGGRCPTEGACSRVQSRSILSLEGTR